MCPDVRVSVRELGDLVREQFATLRNSFPGYRYVPRRRNCEVFANQVAKTSRSRMRVPNPVLLSPGESHRVGRFPIRYNLDESPVLSVMLELLSKDQPAAELIPVVKWATTYSKPATTVNTSDLVKLLPKLPTVDGTDHRTLLRQLDSAAHQLTTRQIDPESPQGATIFTGCFTGTLASWFAQQYKDRTFSGITESSTS